MKFRDAVRQATFQAMEKDPTVLLTGVGIIDPRGVWGTVNGALDQFGPDRVVEGPLSEDLLTGACIGAATHGMRPMIIHHRIDFVLLTMNQLINHAAKWREMFGRQENVPMVVRAVVGRGWGNGPQHTQSLHALFSHVPGMKTVVPSNPVDAKGLLLAAIEDDGPVIYIEHRWLHEDDAPVPETYYVTPLGQGNIVRAGTDATVVAIGPMVPEALKAAVELQTVGISVEVLDPRTIFPLDAALILESVAKTGRLVVADADWGPCGVAGEVMALVSERAFSTLKAAPVRVVWPDTAVPSSQAIERLFYPGAREIEQAVIRACAASRSVGAENTIKQFVGPF